MRIMVHPMFAFDLFPRNASASSLIADRLLEVLDGSVVLHAPIRHMELLSTENEKLYKETEKEIRRRALCVIDYPVKESWKYGKTMDECVLSLYAKDQMIFCGGYVENCLARAYGAFKREYGSYCKEISVDITLDKNRMICCSDVGDSQDVFLNDRVIRKKEYSLAEFEWWSNVSDR